MLIQYAGDIAEIFLFPYLLGNFKLLLFLCSFFFVVMIHTGEAKIEELEEKNI